MRSDLTSVAVLVTRAPHQAGPLCELIEQANGIAVRFPVTTICEVENLPQLESAVAQVRRPVDEGARRDERGHRAAELP